MHRVPPQHVEEARDEYLDAQLRASRFAGRQRNRLYPCMRAPQLDDELCARVACNHRVFRTDAALPGTTYCSAECRDDDVQVRDERRRYRELWLCVRCEVNDHDPRAALPCKRASLCDSCVMTEPCMCQLCGTRVLRLYKTM